MLTYSVSLSERVYCTTWQQGGLHDRLYRLCRYSPASSSSSSSSSSSPSSSPWLNSLRLSAAAVQLLYFHPTSSPYTSLLLVRLVSSLSLSLHHCTLSSVVVLRHGATWPLNREIYFHATMINRINDQTYLCTQLLCRWDDKKTDDISVNCCLQQVKPAPNSIRQCHNLRVSTKNHNYGSSCQKNNKEKSNFPGSLLRIRFMDLLSCCCFSTQQWNDNIIPDYTSTSHRRVTLVLTLLVLPTCVHTYFRISWPITICSGAPLTFIVVCNSLPSP